jgi:hypothetical protein
MKIWEVLKVLSEKPETKFINVRFGGVLGLKHGDLVWIKASQRTGDEFSIHYEPECKSPAPDGGFATGNLLDEWELIPESIPFLEAVKAYAEGKTIRCEICNKKYDYVPNAASLQCNGLGYDLDGVTTAEILEGSWYIEA